MLAALLRCEFQWFDLCSILQYKASDSSVITGSVTTTTTNCRNNVYLQQLTPRKSMSTSVLICRVQDLRDLGELSPHWDNLRKEVMTRYGGLISSYQETLAELDKITGMTDLVLRSYLWIHVHSHIIANQISRVSLVWRFPWTSLLIWSSSSSFSSICKLTFAVLIVVCPWMSLCFIWMQLCAFWTWTKNES